MKGFHEQKAQWIKWCWVHYHIKIGGFPTYGNGTQNHEESDYIDSFFASKESMWEKKLIEFGLLFDIVAVNMKKKHKPQTRGSQLCFFR